MVRKKTARDLAKHIPAELIEVPNWVTWSEVITTSGSKTKKPHGSVLDPSHRYPFERLFDYVCSDRRGIGFCTTGKVIIDGSLLLAFDIDACRNPQTGDISPWAMEIIEHYKRGFCEITPSGTGLRMILLVKNPPQSLPVIKIPTSAPDGVDKTPEIQIFGFGSAQYFTVSGNRLDGTSLEIPTVENLLWIQDKYHVCEIETIDSVSLPVGKGKPPNRSLIVKRVLKNKDGKLLMDGDWSDIGVKSASEAWWRLLRMALKAASNHGEQAVDFLLAETAFGRGEVDSKDPDRYTRRNWVSKDLFRIAGKTNEDGIGSSAFLDGFDPLQWSPPKKKIQTKRILQAADFDKICGSTEMLVYGVLPSQGLAQFFGDPSSGKTPFALSLALHVALGMNWFGHEMEKPGSVIYMIGEDMTGIRDRMNAQLKSLKPDVNLSDIPFYATLEPARLVEMANSKSWIGEIKQICNNDPVSLVVIDTQNRNFGPGNENSTEDMTLFVNSIDTIRKHLKCCVLLVHHVGLQDKDRARGSSVLSGALDAQFEIKRDGDLVMAICHKAKNWAEPKTIRGFLVVEDLGLDRKNRMMTAITLSDKPSKSNINAFVDGEDVEINALVKAIQLSDGERVSQSEICNITAMSRKQLRIKLKYLVEAGLIEVDTNSKGTVYSFTEWGMVNFFPNNKPKDKEEDLFL